VLQIDQNAVQAATQTDAAVQVARMQFQADAAPIAADQTVLQADFMQLVRDLRGF
jgi:hypothetical protein